jgi:streptomycin 6-kinase
VWEWGYMVRVATGIYALEHGMDWGRDKLEAAARLL